MNLIKNALNVTEILPEWSMPDSDDVEELGTFDSSGAFVSTKVGLYWQIWFRRFNSFSDI